jgi:hypothetical protein
MPAAPAAVAASSSSGFDKRVVLRSLQQQCTLDFLRKHGLNGSEDLVLKKRNKEAILAAHREWTQGLGVGGAGGAGTGTEEGEGEDGDATRLRQTFEVLFCRHLAPPAPSSSSSSSSTFASRRRVTVLLLHEDYPQELPVFGTHGPFGGGLEEGSDSAGGQAGQAGHTVVCVLGAVRDTSDAEVAAAFEKLLRFARPDLEAELARIAGDTPAHYATQVVRGLADWGRHAAGAFARNLGEFLTEEGRDLVPRLQLQAFHAESMTPALAAGGGDLAFRIKRLLVPSFGSNGIHFRLTLMALTGFLGVVVGLGLPANALRAHIERGC